MGAEKVIATKAFQHALQQDLEAVIRQAKKMAEKIEQPSDLWELERYLTERRKEIDRQYDYCYSVLLNAFADLLQKGRLANKTYKACREKSSDTSTAWPRLGAHPNFKGVPLPGGTPHEP